MRSANRTILLLAVALFLALDVQPTARAQRDSESCTSFTQIQPGPEGYAIPLQYGSFADVEIGSASNGTVQIDVTVIQQSVLKDRRIWVLVPGRVYLVSEILGVENLFEFGSPLLLRIETSAPVTALLVRR